MVTVYVGGKRVGPWAEAEAAVVAALARAERVELRDDAGRTFGQAVAADDDPDWVKAITPDAIARAMSEPGFTLEEWRKRQGGQRPSPSSGG